MHRKNSLHRVRMRKNKRVLRGIGQGAKFMVVLIGLIVIFKSKLTVLLNSIFSTITQRTGSL